jgi:hypothetical protein
MKAKSSAAEFGFQIHALIASTSRNSENLCPSSVAQFRIRTDPRRTFVYAGLVAVESATPKFSRGRGRDHQWRSNAGNSENLPSSLLAKFRGCAALAVFPESQHAVASTSTRSVEPVISPPEIPRIFAPGTALREFLPAQQAAPSRFTTAIFAALERDRNKQGSPRLLRR